MLQVGENCRIEGKDKGMEPSVSVIIPMYQCESYVKGLISNLKEQTLKDFEVLLIDDGSLDHTVECCIETIGNDSRFKVCRQEHGGVSSARNHGLRIAKGSYITFIDADDTMDHRYLEILYRAMENCDIAICNVVTVGESGTEKIAWRQYDKEEILTGAPARRELLHVWGPYGKMFSRQAIEGCYFDESLPIAEDVKFTTDYILKQDQRLKCVSGCRYYYRLRPGSVTNSGYCSGYVHALEAVTMSIHRLEVQNKLPKDCCLTGLFLSEALSRWLKMPEDMKRSYMEDYTRIRSIGKRETKVVWKYILHCGLHPGMALFTMLYFPEIYCRIKGLSMVR